MKLPRSEAVLHDWRAPLAQLRLGTPVRSLDGGTHRPLLCLLESDSGNSEWVVKTPSMYNGMTTPLLRELIGSDVVAYGGLRTPRAGLLRIPHEPLPTDDSPDGLYARQIFERDAGKLAFCSSYVQAPAVNRTVFVHRGRMNENVLADAVRLYAIDMFLWHGDRTVDNPNCLRLQNRLLPIDHDRVLSRVGTIDATGCGPDLDEEQPHESRHRHVSRELVRKHAAHPGWDEVSGLLADLGGDLPALLQRWPDEWDRNFGDTAPAGLKDDALRFFRHRASRVVAILETVRS